VMVISAGNQAWANHFLLSTRVLVWIGLISYPLYLWHWPLLSFARIMEGQTPSRVIRIAAVCVSVVFAWLSYMFVERPIRFGNYRKTMSVVLVVLIMSVGSVGYVTFKGNGLPFRFSKDIQELSQFSYDYKTAYRYLTCFLGPGQDYTVFDTCPPVTHHDTGKSLLLWGDSYAAHLFPGYRDLFTSNNNIIQRTTYGCPPIIGVHVDGSPNCEDINNNIYQSIVHNKPDKVVLAAAWFDVDWMKFESTITALHRSGVDDIVLIGPVPVWTSALPQLLYLKTKSSFHHTIPNRMSYGLDTSTSEIDLQLSRFARAMNVQYISPLEYLCNQDGCKTMVSDTPDSLTTWDTGHLTDIGSRYLVSQFPGADKLNE
jgi:hypothetical protein